LRFIDRHKNREHTFLCGDSTYTHYLDCVSEEIASKKRVRYSIRHNNTRSKFREVSNSSIAKYVLLGFSRNIIINLMDYCYFHKIEFDFRSFYELYGEYDFSDYLRDFQILQNTFKGIEDDRMLKTVE